MKEERNYPMVISILIHRSSINPKMFRDWINESLNESMVPLKKELTLLIDRAVRPEKKYDKERRLFFSLVNALDYAYEGKLYNETSI